MNDDTANQGKVQTRSYEHEYVHPAMAQWLAHNGYTYKHEVKTPVGRIDFLAEHPDRAPLIVECKSDCDTTQSALRQVLDYQRHLGTHYQCVFAVPAWSVLPTTIKACESRGIELVALDVPERLNQQEEKPLWMRRLPIYEDLRITPQKIVAKILEFHREHNTSPLRDLLTAWSLAREVVERSNSLASPTQKLIDVSPIEAVYEQAINRIDDQPCESLQEFTENRLEFLETVSEERATLQKPFIAKFGIVPENERLSTEWEAQKKAEFYAMAFMIDHFDYIGDGINELIFVDSKGQPVDTSLVWEGSANSFETAEEWHAWRQANRPSYFDDPDFLFHD